MNEKKRLYIVLGAIVLLIALIGGLIFNSYKKQQAVYNEFKEAFNGTENALVYIGRPTCGYCNLLNPSLEEMADRYEFDYIYLNTDEISSSFMEKILSDLGLTTVGTPYLAVVSNGKVLARQNGYADYDLTFEFLQENDIIAEDAELLLNYIDLDEYKTLLAEDELNVIVVGQSTCSYCIQAKLILNQIVEEKNIDINYFNVSYLESEEEVAEFEETLEYLQSSWGTPVTLITKNGELVDVMEGLSTKNGYIEFLEENEVL